MESQTHCPFDQTPLTVVSRSNYSTHGFAYDIRRCPSCGFENKLLLDSLSEIYKFVYDENRFIEKRLNNTHIPERAYVKRFVARYGQGGQSTVLEVGPGRAGNLMYVKRQGMTTVTLDISDTNNRYYQEICQFDHVYNNAEDIPDESLDLILMTHVVEHIDEPVAALKRLYPKLSPGGAILVSTPSTESVFSTMMQTRWWVYAVDDHVSFFNLTNLAQLLESGGFRVKEIRSFGTDAAHALSQFVRNDPNIPKRNVERAFVNENAPLLSDGNLSLKRMVHNQLLFTINAIFLPFSWLGMGYEAVCIAVKPSL